MLKNFFRFGDVIYPLWRRKVSPLIQPVTEKILETVYPIQADKKAPQSAQEMARFLLEWDIIRGADEHSLVNALENSEAHIEFVDRDAKAPLHDGSPIRIPAQWEQTERALIAWGRMYPKMWDMHAQMAEAISQVAIAEILIPSEMWAKAVAVYLKWRGHANMDNIHLLVLRTDDIWIRDYGSIIGIADEGHRVALNATYDVLPQYPQADDDGMAERWAAHHGVSIQPIDLHTEGGNLWSDGQGTLIMSSQIFYSNTYYKRDTILDYLHGIIHFEKAIITPRLTLEETGHVDLLLKLASENTVFVSKASSFSTEEVLRKVKRLFERESNAKGEPYQVFELPTPSLYLNWFTYGIRRAYTNSLTINGRVLVPVFGIKQDDMALKTYAQAMPDYDIIPIDSHIGINGGGAVHCMTREVPFVG
jgi:agmatine deiminase